MKLAGTDETDLLIPLYAGVHDQALWRTFLARVMRRTGADHAALVMVERDEPRRPLLEVFAGRNLYAEANALGLAEGLEQLRQSYPRLRPGRVYQAAELLPADRPSREVQEGYRRALGVSDERVVRMAEQEDVNGWLVLSRNHRTFSAADGALLAALLPHVAVAVRSFVLAERQRLNAAITAAALGRAGAGWITFGRDGRMLDIDPRLAPVLAKALGVDGAALEHALLGNPATRQTLAEAARSFAEDRQSAPRVAALSREPRIEALLVPADASEASVLIAPAVLALCRLPQESGSRQASVAELFGLSAREAELAVLLSGGATISGAADSMGLKEETARGYSKQIYAKMDVSGQAALVRRVLLSVAAFD